MLLWMSVFGLCVSLACSNFAAHADVEQTPPRKAFLSGGARSEQVLVEISDTLKRIEQRLVQMEKTIRKTGQQTGRN